jgi:DNA end-binding protein Ku
VAPRAYWKGYLKLSLVSCPVALFPASSEREKISFHQINKKTGNRIKYRKVDAETGDEVDSADIVKGYQVGKGEYIEVEPEELEAIAIESKRTIEIDEFVPRKEIDELYLDSPYYIVPDGEVGQQAFAVIREAIRKEGMVALARVVFTSREHVIALEPRGKGLLGVTLRYPYEVRKEDEYFDEIEDEKIPKDMMDLASHIVETKSGHFKPEEFEDHYEDALKELLKKKQAGEKIEAPRQREPAKVISLMDALRRSVSAERGGGARAILKSRGVDESETFKRVHQLHDIRNPIVHFPFDRWDGRLEWDTVFPTKIGTWDEDYFITCAEFNFYDAVASELYEKLQELQDSATPVTEYELQKAISSSDNVVRFPRKPEVDDED